MRAVLTEVPRGRSLWRRLPPSVDFSRGSALHWSVDVEKCLEFTADSFEIHRRRARCMRAVGQKDPGTEHREELG